MRIILVLLTFLFLTAGAPSPWEADRLIGTKAPDFQLKDMAARTVSLSSFKGKVVLVSFWATWCPPCRAEMPALNKLYKGYRDKGLVVVAVSTDRKVEYVKDYLGKYPVDFPVLMDSDVKVSRQYGVFSMPTSFLLDKNGIIIKRYLGEEDWNSTEIKSVIKAALGL
jgi:peroxiredoxin